MWNDGYEFVYDRMYDIHNKCTGKTPVNREFQTHISLDVKGKIAVIPPFVVKHLFQQKSGNEFQYGCKEKRSDKKYNQIFFQRRKSSNYDYNSTSVDWTIWSIQKSTVYKFSGVQCGVPDLRAPSDKRINNKYPK